MKKILVSIAAVVVAAGVAFANAGKLIPPMESSGFWYVAGYGGASLYQSGVKSEVFNAFSLDQSKKIGVTAGLKLGYEFAPCDFFAPVLELDVMYYHVHRNVGVNTGTRWVTANAATSNAGVVPMLNALAKFDCAYGLRPYAGFGLGWYYMHSNIDVNSNRAFVRDSFCDNMNGFAWSLIGGVDYDLSSNWVLFTEYKWLNFQTRDRRNFVYDGADVLKSRIGQQLLNIGVRYNF